MTVARFALTLSGAPHGITVAVVAIPDAIPSGTPPAHKGKEITPPAMIIEVCVDCQDSVAAGAEGGADRIELCAGLVE